MTTIDDSKLRSRLAEIRASAGVPEAQIALEVLFMMPRAFLDAYEEMFRAAVKSDGGEGNRNTAQQQIGDLGKATVSSDSKTGKGAKPQKKRYKKTFIVLDERALALKQRMDKRLRNLAREIAGELQGTGEGKGSEGELRTCGKCGVFVSAGWNFCPKDGERVVDM